MGGSWSCLSASALSRPPLCWLLIRAFLDKLKKYPIDGMINTKNINPPPMMPAIAPSPNASVEPVGEPAASDDGDDDGVYVVGTRVGRRVGDRSVITGAWTVTPGKVCCRFCDRVVVVDALCSVDVILDVEMPCGGLLTAAVYTTLTPVVSRERC
jgi:hypothetical protein